MSTSSYPPSRDREPEGDDLGASGASWPVPASSRAAPKFTLWSRIRGLIRTIRPHQWVKNVFVLAPVVFAREIFRPGLLTSAALAFLVFCLLAGAIYTINDLADIEADREHPVKRHRPIASGRVPVSVARIFAATLILVSLTGATWLSPWFGAVAAGYFVLNLAYTFRLKHLAYLDVGCISAGFVMRVMGGGFATETHISGYLYACTATLALYFGFGKRRHELTTAVRAGKQRAALEGYTREGLDKALLISGAITTLLYLAYTLDSQPRQFFQSDTLWPSTVLVALGLARFLFLVRNRPKAESPTQVMLSDGPGVAIVLVWAAMLLWVVYHLQPGVR
jgi:decaprenyl-phosphate phosphoribosyltransferase